MLNLLKSLLAGAPRARKVLELEAKLLPVSGANLFGEAEFELYDDEGWEFEAEVDFRGGLTPAPMTLWLDGREFMTLSPDHDESEGKLSSRRGDRLTILPKEGMQVDIKQAGNIMLQGTLTRQGRGL